MSGDKSVWYISKYANILKYGANTRQFSFCKGFKKLGYKPTLIVGNSSHLYDTLPKFQGDFFHEKYENVDIIWINLPKYKKATSVKRFWTWLLFEYKIIKLYKKFPANNPDVVIASSLSILSIISGVFLKYKLKAKFIFEVRDIWPQTLIDLNGLSKFHPIVLTLRTLEKFGYKKADLIVGTMSGLYRHVIQSVNVPEGKVINIPQGVDLDFYNLNQEKLDNGFVNKYFPKNKFTIVYAGTLAISYALDKVIKAAEILNTTNPNVHFLFLGNGLEKEALQKQAKGLNNVTFVPRIPKEQVLDFLSRSSVLLHSFKMKKVFEYGISPNKFIDYMYSARPIIVMFSGHQSLINQANCGIFIESEDYISLAEVIEEYYKKSYKELDKLGQNGKDYLLNNLTFEILSKKYSKLF